MRLYRLILFVGLLFSLGCIAQGTKESPQQGVNGGYSCLSCTAVVALLEQLMGLKNLSIEQAMEELCNYLPRPFTKHCRLAVSFVEPVIVPLIIHLNGPDVVCRVMKFCYTEEGYDTCTTVIPPFESLELTLEEKVQRATKLVKPQLLKLKFPDRHDVCKLPGISMICKYIRKSITNRKPMVDIDQDGFSPTFTFRGSAWRGRDCNDIVPQIHPGRKPIERDVDYDSNCNGIYGVNNVTKQPYEDELCKMSDAKGVVALGDSISAHFSLPPNWLDATIISKDAFKHLAMILENEMDWPMLSSTTGHGMNNWTEVIRGPVDSIYNRMVERNRCNHRDYQNIARNGETSFTVHQLMKTLSRDPTRDKPLLVSYALVGNDVCDGSPVDLSNMTSPNQFYNNTMTTLKYLNEHLPVGSYVAMIGLADGRSLFQEMKDRMHPAGMVWQDFTYSQFYDYMNCLRISPCPAWMHTDPLIRNKAARHVRVLNKVLKSIVNAHKGDFTNFKLFYLANPTKRVLNKWRKAGGFGWQLVEPSDGLHTNQMGQALSTGVIWEMLTKSAPRAIGPINPHNTKILRLFGDQGGL